MPPFRRTSPLLLGLPFLAFAALAALACTSDDPTATPTPSPSPTSEATQTPLASPPAAPTPELFEPTVAPDGRTPDANLNALIESLLTDDAETLAQRYATADAREFLGAAGERPLSPDQWTSRLTTAHRSLYAVTRDPQIESPRNLAVTLDVSVDGRREGWRFIVDADRILELVVFDQPSTFSVTRRYAAFLVLPPAEDLPQPPTGYRITTDSPNAGDPEVNALLRLLAAGHVPWLLDIVTFDDGGTLPVQQCGGARETRDLSYVERWLTRLVEQTIALHAVAQVPAGYLPTADHLIVLVRQTGPYDWETAGLLESDGRIVGILTGCVNYPPAAFVVPPPPEGRDSLDPTRRSDVPTLDGVLDALAANDRDALLSLIDPTEVGCITEPLGIGSPPFCRDDEPEGTLLRVLPTGGCEGSYARHDELDVLLDNLLDTDWLLYAVVERGELEAGFGGSYRGYRWAILAAPPQPGFGAIGLNITDRGIAGVWWGCGAYTPHMILAATGGDPSFLLPPPAARSALWLIDVESGRRLTLHQGDAQASARFDADGQTLTTFIHLDDRRYRALRYNLDGRVIEQYEDRVLIFTSPDQASRFYYRSQRSTPEVTRLTLEHDGVPVPIADADKGTYGVSFSPDSSRLLINSGSADGPSVVVFTSHVVSVETGLTLFTFQSRSGEGTDGGEEPRWSPSSRYLASAGHIAGLVVHDSQTGDSTPLVGGFPRWSPDPTVDAILALDDAGNLDLVRFPGAARTRLATNPDIHHPRFGATGRYVYWTNSDQTATTVLDTRTSEIVATWDAPTADYMYPGVYPIAAVPGGIAVLLDANTPPVAASRSTIRPSTMAGTASRAQMAPAPPVGPPMSLASSTPSTTSSASSTSPPAQIVSSPAA